MKYREFRADTCVLDVLVRVAYPVFQEQFKGIIVRTEGSVKAILLWIPIANRERDVLHCT